MKKDLSDKDRLIEEKNAEILKLRISLEDSENRYQYQNKLERSAEHGRSRSTQKLLGLTGLVNNND